MWPQECVQPTGWVHSEVLRVRYNSHADCRLSSLAVAAQIAGQSLDKLRDKRSLGLARFGPREAMNVPSMYQLFLTLAILAGGVLTPSLGVIQVSRAPKTIRRAGFAAVASSLLAVAALAGAFAS